MADEQAILDATLSGSFDLLPPIAPKPSRDHELRCHRRWFHRRACKDGWWVQPHCRLLAQGGPVALKPAGSAALGGVSGGGGCTLTTMALATSRMEAGSTSSVRKARGCPAPSRESAGQDDDASVHR